MGRLVTGSVEAVVAAGVGGADGGIALRLGAGDAFPMKPLQAGGRLFKRDGRGGEVGAQVEHEQLACAGAGHEELFFFGQEREADRVGQPVARRHQRVHPRHGVPAGVAEDFVAPAVGEVERAVEELQLAGAGQRHEHARHLCLLEDPESAGLASLRGEERHFSAG